MSPSATGGPIHTRVLSINGGPPGRTSSGAKANGADAVKPSNRVMLHHDDLITAIPDVNINSPIGTVLREADRLAKAADSSLDFRRPDIALQEYVRASIVVVDIIPRHKDYPSLHLDRPDLHRIYMGVTKRIKAQDKKFMEVKRIVKENNKLHGTQSVASNRSDDLSSETMENGLKSEINAKPLLETVRNGSATNGASKKTPPPVQPKPDALQGKSIQKLGMLNGHSQREDLAARFARLRSGESIAPIQDPRIRTQLIPISNPFISAPKSLSASQPSSATISRPTGPREMPSAPKTVPQPNKIPLEVEIPDLPKAPDAIYSPARGTETAATSNLPSSVRKNSYIGGGQQNAPPVSKVVPTPIIVDSRKEYFSSEYSLDQNSYSTWSSRGQQPSFTNSTLITAEQLMSLLNQGYQSPKILLVDLRNREDFDSGHIMSRYIICVEPITLRNGISGDELADSMIISPEVEQKVYDIRHEFDYLVFYDQSSTSLQTAKSSNLYDFATAVYDFSYEKRLQHPPLLLVGGLDAWVDLLGPNSLEFSSTSNSATAALRAGTKTARPLNRIVAQNLHDFQQERHKAHYSRPLTTEQEKIWDSTIKEDLTLPKPEDRPEGSVLDELVYVRTPEEFIRKYPEIPPVPESMITGVSPSKITDYDDKLASLVPKPPRRPAPALPRHRSSGISERDSIISYPPSAENTYSITDNRLSMGLTGLSNPGVLCYMNTSIQGLSATYWLRNLIRNYIHPASPPIPRKSGESTDPPQLMVRCLKSVFEHLWFGHYDYINPTTLVSYVNAVHNKGQIGFGGKIQHDSSEFLILLLDILDDELNPLRDRPTYPPMTPEQERAMNTAPTVAEAAQLWWSHTMVDQGSPITQRMKGVTVRILTCDLCKTSRPSFQQFTSFMLPIPDSGNYSILDCFNLIYGPDSTPQIYPELLCEKCGANTSHTGQEFLVFLPDTLVIYLVRFRNPSVHTNKVKTTVNVPLTVNFDNTFKPDEPRSKCLDHRGRGTFTYECYALGLHVGDTISSGHYKMLARSLDQPVISGSGKAAGSWHMFDDKRVTPDTFPRNGSEISLVFLQRQGYF